jgi:hypothetical protein
MDERDRDEREDPVRHETTIINAGGREDGGGGGAAILAVVVALLVGIAAFLYFGGYLGGTRENPDININVKAPDIDVKAPNIDLKVPEVTINPPAGGGNNTQ